MYRLTYIENTQMKIQELRYLNDIMNMFFVYIINNTELVNYYNFNTIRKSLKK